MMVSVPLLTKQKKINNHAFTLLSVNRMHISDAIKYGAF